VLEFTRQLIRETVNKDVIHLAMLAAASRVGVPHEEAAVLLRAVLAEKEHYGHWPKEF
jgi:hypothetical protein